MVGITFLGCNKDAAPPFSQEKIENILLQVHLTDAGSASLIGEIKDSIALLYMNQVKEINQITDEEIESIFTYLRENPEFSAEVYSNLVTTINELKESKKKKAKDKKSKEKNSKEKNSKADKKKEGSK